jgi:phosphoglycolate phosphatase-like HAD superfamily hydrolase
VPVANVTLIGDTPLDIECAKKAGCAIVAVTTGNYTREQLAPLQPDVVCERLTEVKGFSPRSCGVHKLL